jgi:hypothetical protein
MFALRPAAEEGAVGIKFFINAPRQFCWGY